MTPLAAGLRELGVTVDLLFLGNLRRPAGLLSAMREVRRRSVDYDLTHAQFGSACGFVSTAARGPKVLSLRGSDWHRYRGPNWSEWRAGLLATGLSRLSIRSYDSVVTMSERMTSGVRAMAGHPRVATVPDPIDTSRFHPRDREACRRALGRADDTAKWVLFTTINAANPVKRLALAKQAIEEARRRCGNVELRVATGIPHEQMPIFVGACDAALCTSTHEGWPNSIKEAIASGVPFVSTDVSDLATVSRAHPSCRVVAPDAGALAAALCDALSAPRDRTLPSAVRHMDIKTSSRRLHGVYRQLLDERTREES